VPSRITAKNDDLSLEIDLETDGTPRVRSITVLGDDIKTEHLRRLPIARLTREAVDGAARKMDDGVFRLVSTPRAEAAAFYSDCMQNVRPVRKGSPITDEHLRQAVDVYRAAIANGDSPTQTVADTLHASRPTARWVQKARKRGLLGAAVPGRAATQGDEVMRGRKRGKTWTAYWDCQAKVDPETDGRAPRSPRAAFAQRRTRSGFSTRLCRRSRRERMSSRPRNRSIPSCSAGWT
jgi:hypothetical protein